MDNQTLNTAADTAPVASPAATPDMLTALTDLMQVGGPVVMILFAMSVFATAIVLLKVWQFQSAKIFTLTGPRAVLALYKAGTPLKALDRADRSRNPVSHMLAGAIRGRRRQIPEHLVREEIVRHGAHILEALRSWLRPLEVIGSLAPLLGLFGTVLGMISAFQGLEAAGNKVNPAILSGGIWEALLTTAVGLAVAMPVVVVHNYFDRAIERLAHEMESLVTQIFTEDLSAKSSEKDRTHEPLGRAAAVAAGE
tara:strand:- start:7751 stop:8509 length:759 start_codon:yes stop_codon:yes gene_type:complete